MRAGTELLRQPALAHSGLAPQQEQPAAPREDIVETAGQLRQLPLSADEAGALRRRGRDAGRRCGVERGILLEDALVELAQPASRFDPELLDEHPAGVRVDLERLGLAAGAVEGQHELAAGALSQRLGRDQPLQPPDHLLVVAEREVGLDPVLARGQMKLLEPGDLGLGERLVGQVAKRRAPPELERRVQLRAGGARIVGRQRASPLAHERLESLGIEPLGIDPQLVARRARQEHAALAGGGTGLEDPPQSRDGHLERLDRLVRALTGPQLVDQAVARDDLVRVQEQHSEKRSLSGAAQGEWRVAVGRLERPEDVEVHRPSPSDERNTRPPLMGGSGARRVEQLEQLVGRQLDLLVPPLCRPVVARDQAGPM